MIISLYPSLYILEVLSESFGFDLGHCTQITSIYDAWREAQCDQILEKLINIGSENIISIMIKLI